MKFGVLIFPGSSGETDCFNTIERLEQPVRYVWHKETSLRGLDCVVLPGGYSFGDSLRPGAIAARSPIMDEVRRFAAAGRPIIGIDNGFQILTEAGLLPGALLPNRTLRFICGNRFLKVSNTRSPFTHLFRNGEVIEMPIAHGNGNYFADAETLKELEDEGQIVFQYVDADGRATPESNPNGALNNIAGIISRGRNVLGMMPQPERCADPALGNAVGRKVFEAVLSQVGI